MPVACGLLDAFASPVSQGYMYRHITGTLDPGVIEGRVTSAARNQAQNLIACILEQVCFCLDDDASVVRPAHEARRHVPHDRRPPQAEPVLLNRVTQLLNCLGVASDGAVHWERIAAQRTAALVVLCFITPSASSFEFLHFPPQPCFSAVWTVMQQRSTSSGDACDLR